MYFYAEGVKSSLEQQLSNAQSRKLANINTLLTYNFLQKVSLPLLILAFNIPLTSFMGAKFISVYKVLTNFKVGQPSLLLNPKVIIQNFSLILHEVKISQKLKEYCRYLLMI